MFKKVDHIAIAVRNLEETKKKMIDLFGAKFIVEKVNTEGQYKVAIMQVGDSTFSFLEPTTPESFVARHLEKFGETMQHLGLEVENLDKFIEHFNAQGLKTSNYAEIPGVRREAKYLHRLRARYTLLPRCRARERLESWTRHAFC